MSQLCPLAEALLVPKLGSNKWSARFEVHTVDTTAPDLVSFTFCVADVYGQDLRPLEAK